MSKLLRGRGRLIPDARPLGPSENQDVAVTVRRCISKRSHEKIGDCEQSILLATLNQKITSIRSLGYYIPESTVRTDRNHLVENVANASHSEFTETEQSSRTYES